MSGGAGLLAGVASRGGVSDTYQHARAYALIPVLLAAALVLPTLGQRTIYLSDEARYALLARSMVEHGHWLVPRMGNEVHMEKSPLFMWAIAVPSLVAGDVTELTAVLPSAVSGIGGVAATFFLGRRLFGALAGLFGALVLCTTWGYFWLARAALADMTVACFIIVGTWAFWTAIEAPARAGRALIACYACLGLAFSAKGPAGLAPLIPFAAFLIAEEGWRGLRRLRLLTGLGVVALIASPWAIAFAVQRDASYVQTVLLDDYFGPHARAWDRLGELGFAAGPLALEFLPWSLLLPLAVWDGYVRGDAETRRKFKFLLCWVVAYIVMMTVMAHKRDRYLLPAYPALALMVGWLWQRWAARPARRGLRWYGLAWSAVTAALVAATLVPLAVRPEVAVLFPSTLVEKVVAVTVIAAAGVAGLGVAWAGRVRTTFAIVGLTTALILGYEAWTFAARYNARYDVRGFAERIASRLGPEDDVVAFQSGRLSYDFYLRRPVREVSDARELALLLGGGRRVYVIVDARAWKNLNSTGLALRVLEQRELAGRMVFLATRAGDSG